MKKYGRKKSLESNSQVLVMKCHEGLCKIGVIDYIQTDSCFVAVDITVALNFSYLSITVIATSKHFYRTYFYDKVLDLTDSSILNGVPVKLMRNLASGT